MKYINIQSKNKCINAYKVSMYYIKDLSVYAKLDDKKILLGSYNTKEDAQNEYKSIIANLGLSVPIVYQVNSEEYWIKNRIEVEINDIFNGEPDIPTMDYDEDEDIDTDDYIDDPAYLKAEENIIDTEEDKIEDDMQDSIDNE